MRTLIFTAHDGVDDGRNVTWFQVQNRTNPNPTVVVEPDVRVILHVYNAGNRSHNLRVSPPVQTATPILEPGNETSVSMKVPADATGSLAYYDQVHRDDGAEGRFEMASHGGPQEDDDGSGTTTLALAGGAGLAVLAAGWWSGRDRG
jgi:hypothetical protein